MAKKRVACFHTGTYIILISPYQASGQFGSKAKNNERKNRVVCILSSIFSLTVFHIASQLNEMPGTV